MEDFSWWVAVAVGFTVLGFFIDAIRFKRRLQKETKRIEDKIIVDGIRRRFENVNLPPNKIRQVRVNVINSGQRFSDFTMQHRRSDSDEWKDFPK